MQITCDKCQTSYQVDDQLIPPEGAPVQCTKCGNLFTAFPAPPPARAPSRTVMMFAADPVGPVDLPPASPAAPQRTMTAPVPQAPAAAQPAPRPATASQPAAPTPFSSARTQAFGIPATPPSSRTQPAMPQAPAPSTPAARPPSASYPVAPGSVPTARVPSSAPVPMAPANAPGVMRGPSSTTIPAAGGPTSPLDQPVDLSRPGRMTQMFYKDGDAAEQANLKAAPEEPDEPERKPGQTAAFLQAADLEKQLRSRNRGALIVVSVLLVGAAAAVIFALYGQEILGPPGADRQARQDLDAALLTVKKDDAASLQAADKAIADILARKPMYMAAKADRALVQQFLADNSLWQTERLKASYDALGKQIRAITARNDPNEAPQRAKDVDAMTAINKQYEAVGKQAKAFEDQGKILIDEAAKAEPKNPVVLRAQAFLTADHDQAEGTQKLTRLYLRESGLAKDGWAELALAESDVAGKPSEEKRTDGLTHAKAALALDPALVRALLLEVRLEAVNKKEAEAKADAAALLAANPAHSGGAAQVAALEEELTREKIDKDARDAKVAAQAKADAAAEAQAAAPAAEDPKKPAPKAAAKRNR